MNRSFPRLLLTASALAAMALVALPAQATAFSKIVIFGDSLSDSGNNSALGANNPLQIITGNTYVPMLTYGDSPTGTYSNGPVWATYFAQALGLSAIPAVIPNLGGTNFAFGGATTGSVGLVPSLSAQVGMFLGSVAGVAPSDALYVIAGGGNNARDAGVALQSAESFAEQIPIFTNNASNFATDVGNMVDSLQAAGAQNIIVWNAPNVGATPFAQATGTQALGALLATTMNDALTYRLSSETGVKIFDVFGLVNQVQANPGAFGLVDTTNACGQVPVVCDADTALFWDGIHPTTAGHQILANAMMITAVPEPETYGLMAIGLLVVAAAARRRAA